MKICVLISSHSPSFFTKMTVKSLLRQVKGHELSIHVGFHSNLGDYTNDFSMFSELRGLCQFHAVDEIDWMAHNEDTYRYSKMHCKNLENLLKNVRYEEFDYLCVLDNDLLVKKDFITHLLDEFHPCDLICSLFDDRTEVASVDDMHGNTIRFAPKASVWNMLLSRSSYEMIMRDVSVIYPKFRNGMFYDSFAEFLEKCGSKCIVNTEKMVDMITHFHCSSFNYGIIMNRRSIEEPLRIYEENFA